MLTLYFQTNKGNIFYIVSDIMLTLYFQTNKGNIFYIVSDIMLSFKLIKVTYSI